MSINSYYDFDNFVQSMNKFDNNNYTPLVRAIFNESYDAIKYLLQNVEDPIPKGLQIK